MSSSRVRRHNEVDETSLLLAKPSKAESGPRRKKPCLTAWGDPDYTEPKFCMGRVTLSGAGFRTRNVGEAVKGAWASLTGREGEWDPFRWHTLYLVSWLWVPVIRIPTNILTADLRKRADKEDRVSFQPREIPRATCQMD